MIPRSGQQALIPNFFDELKEAYEGPLVEDLGLTRREFERLVSGRPFHCEKLKKVLNRLNMSFGTFIYGNPDAFIAADNLLGVASNSLPFEHLNAAYSKRRIGRILFSILDKYFHPYISKEVKRILQIGDNAFDKKFDDLNVCTELYAKIYWILKNVFKFNDENLYWIGQKTAEYHKDSELGKKFQRLKREEAYQYFLIEVAKHVEHSYQYELFCCDKNKVVIRKRFAGHVLDEFKTDSYGNSESDIYSLGFTTTIGYFSAAHFPRAKKTACIYENQSFSEFTIDLTQLDSPAPLPHQAHTLV